MLRDLFWLPKRSDWDEALAAAKKLPAAEAAARMRELANSDIDFMQTAQLDRAIQKIAEAARAEASDAKPVKLALLGSSTLGHLVPGIRVAGYRRGLWIEIYEGEYGLYRQELEAAGAGTAENSALKEFAPDVVLLALDARQVTRGNADDALLEMEACWQLAKKNLGCVVVQQTVIPVFPRLLGSNEHRLASSPHTVVERVNETLRGAAEREGVALLAVDEFARAEGIREWHDAALWHRSKQEVHPRVGHLYGEHVGRLLAALRGRSYKALVLDLDNTLWGGVIGDDGLEGIVLGQGNAVGESYVAFQQYARALAARGVVLAVCSKNDEANAIAPFEEHPEMVLRRKDIAAFVANWQDKAANLRAIAEQLDLGLDALVFVDDNPFERNLVRAELPMVAVPEMPEDPADYIDTIAAAGYFETAEITEEDLKRGEQYQARAAREEARESATDMAGYLRGLEMRLEWSRFDRVGLARIVQLINKTNQFNLTTRRYTEAEVVRTMEDPRTLTLQLRLVDRYGDNGIISLLIGKLGADGSMVAGDGTLVMDTWLMSCRVLGRQVEEATLNLLVAEAAKMGAKRIEGTYIPTKKNGMVREHYGRLGFEKVEEGGDGSSRWRLELGDFRPREVFMMIVETSGKREQEANGADGSGRDLQAAHHPIS
jgi:FkbH-like protein